MTPTADPRYLELLRRRGRVDSLPMPRPEPDPPASVVAEVEAMKAAVLRDRGARLVHKHYDLRPVPAEATPEPEHQEEPVATAAAETNGVKLCATCGKPCHASNGRCYACRPGGGGGRPRGNPGTKPKATPDPPLTSRPEWGVVAEPASPAVRPAWDGVVGAARPAPAPAPLSAPDIAAVVALVRLMDRLDAAAVRAVYEAWSEGGGG